METSVELPKMNAVAMNSPEDKEAASSLPNDASTAITNEIDTQKEVKSIEVKETKELPIANSETMNSFGVGASLRSHM